VSKIRLTPNASGTGTVTLTVPSTSTDRTLTLPDNTGTIISTESSVPPKVPMFFAYLGSNQSLTQATSTVIQLNTEEIDTHGWYDTSTYRYTPQTAGYYFFTFNFFIQGVINANVVLARINKNGSSAEGARVVQMHPGADGDFVLSTSVMIGLNGSTDYVDFMLYQGHVTTRTIVAGRGRTSASGFLLRAT